MALMSTSISIGRTTVQFLTFLEHESELRPVTLPYRLGYMICHAEFNAIKVRSLNLLQIGIAFQNMTAN